MAFKTVESMRTKDGIYIDRVIRPETQKEENMGIKWAKQRKWFFLYNCTLDENLAWATCEIQDDDSASYNFEKYEAYVEEVEPEPETPVEPEEPVEPENPEEETPTEEPVVEGE